MSEIFHISIGTLISLCTFASIMWVGEKLQAELEAKREKLRRR